MIDIGVQPGPTGSFDCIAFLPELPRLRHVHDSWHSGMRKITILEGIGFDAPVARVQSSAASGEELVAGSRSESLPMSA
jgi:hypothetical protein